MKATRHEMHKSMLDLIHLKQLWENGTQEHTEFETRAAREYARHKTREVQQQMK